MPGVINKLPQGLLGFLGIKNGGRYPEELATVLAPTWDMRELYTNTNSESRADVASVNVLGYTSFVTVPNGEYWLVLLQSLASGTLGVGVTIDIGIGITDPAAIATTAITDMTGSRTAGQRIWQSIRQPYYVGPGFTIGALCSQLAAGPVSLTLASRIVRFPV